MQDTVFIMAGKREVEATDPNRVSVRKAAAAVSTPRTAAKDRGKTSPPTAPLSQRMDAPSTMMMASSSSSSSSSSLKRRRQPDDSPSEDIPTVMLTRSDAADLEELMELSTHLAADFLTEYAIHSHARHMVLSSELFGDFDYPKVWSQEHLIFVLGQGQW